MSGHDPGCENVGYFRMGDGRELLPDVMCRCCERALRADLARLQKKALQLPLIFHSGGAWGDEKAEEWSKIAGTTEATTKVMCDAIRRALLPTAPERPA